MRTAGSRATSILRKRCIGAFRLSDSVGGGGGRRSRALKIWSRRTNVFQKTWGRQPTRSPWRRSIRGGFRDMGGYRSRNSASPPDGGAEIAGFRAPPNRRGGGSALSPHGQASARILYQTPAHPASILWLFPGGKGFFFDDHPLGAGLKCDKWLGRPIYYYGGRCGADVALDIAHARGSSGEESGSERVRLGAALPP